MSLIQNRIYQFGEFRLRVSARVLERDGKPVQLGSRAFEVLLCLITHAGEVVTKEFLLKTAWPESFVEEGNLAQHIFALRKALGDCSTYIVTIPGRGYQFTETVRETVEPAISQPVETGSFLLQRMTERTHVTIEETSQQPIGVQSPTSPSQPGDGVSIRRSSPSTMEVATPETPALSGSRGAALPPPGQPKRTMLWVVAGVMVLVTAGGWFAWRRLDRKSVV